MLSVCLSFFLPSFFLYFLPSFFLPSFSDSSYLFRPIIWWSQIILPTAIVAESRREGKKYRGKKAIQRREIQTAHSFKLSLITAAPHLLCKDVRFHLIKKWSGRREARKKRGEGKSSCARASGFSHLVNTRVHYFFFCFCLFGFDEEKALTAATARAAATTAGPSLSKLPHLLAQAAVAKT